MSEATTSPMLTEQFMVDPYTVIARLRAEDPVHWCPIPGFGFWFVTRYDDVRQLFTDPNVTNDPRAYERYVAPPEGSYMAKVADKGLFSLPPEEHARVRRLVSAAFTPRAIARMDDQVGACQRVQGCLPQQAVRVRDQADSVHGTARTASAISSATRAASADGSAARVICRPITT